MVAWPTNGLTNPQIDEQLLMNRATVRTHIEHVLTKPGFSSRVEVAADAVRRRHDSALVAEHGRHTGPSAE